MSEKNITLNTLQRFLENIKTNLKISNPGILKLKLKQNYLRPDEDFTVTYDGSSQMNLDLTPGSLGCVAIGDTVNKAVNATSAISSLEDDKEQIISNTYIKKIELEGNNLIITKGDNTLQVPNLKIPDTIYSVATTSTAGLLSAIDKEKLDGLDWQANKYELPAASKTTLGGVKCGSDVTDIDGLFPCPIVEGIPYYGLTEYNLSKEKIAAAEGIIKGENIVSGEDYDSFSISYNDKTDPTLEIAKLLMDKRGLTIYGDTSTEGTLAATIASNDYAELRDVVSIQFSQVKPGLVLTECEKENDTICITEERLMPVPMVYSDTYGMVIGAKSGRSIPICISGRVLVYPYEDRETYKLGDAVCSAPEGKVSKMSREEIKEYPDRILGYVSCIPNYEVWNEDVEVKGRIWIRVK